MATTTKRKTTEDRELIIESLADMVRAAIGLGITEHEVRRLVERALNNARG